MTDAGIIYEGNLYDYKQAGELNSQITDGPQIEVKDDGIVYDGHFYEYSEPEV